MLYTNIPHSVEKALEGGIFIEDKLIKEVPVTIKGTYYNKIFNLRKVNGAIEIEGEKVELNPMKIGGTTVYKHINLKIQDKKGGLLYNSSSYLTDKTTGNVKETSEITYKKDLTQFFGITGKIKEAYGESSYFKAPKELKVIINRK